MKVAAIHGARDLRIEHRSDPTPTSTQLLLRTRSVGMCGSDLHYFRGGGIGPTVINSPMVPGHEIAAEIVDDRASEFGLEVGSRVAVDPALPCGRCEWCRQGFHNLCPNTRFMGSPQWDGGLAEYLAVPSGMIVPVPDSMDDDEIALLEPLGVAIHALDLARLHPFQAIGIIGAGPIGLLMLQMARACGALEIHVAEPLRHRREAASALGADSVHVHHSGIVQATGGRGVDVVLEATDSPDGLMASAEAARIGGKLVAVGIPSQDRIGIDASLVRNKGLSVRFSHRMGHVYTRAIRLVQDGRAQLKALVSHRFQLEDGPTAFAMLADHEDHVVKAVIHF